MLSKNPKIRSQYMVTLKEWLPTLYSDALVRLGETTFCCAE